MNTTLFRFCKAEADADETARRRANAGPGHTWIAIDTNFKIE